MIDSLIASALETPFIDDVVVNGSRRAFAAALLGYLLQRCPAGATRARKNGVTRRAIHNTTIRDNHRMDSLQQKGQRLDPMAHQDWFAMRR